MNGSIEFLQVIGSINGIGDPEKNAVDALGANTFIDLIGQGLLGLGELVLRSPEPPFEFPAQGLGIRWGADLHGGLLYPLPSNIKSAIGKTSSTSIAGAASLDADSGFVCAEHFPSVIFNPVNISIRSRSRQFRYITAHIIGSKGLRVKSFFPVVSKLCDKQVKGRKIDDFPIPCTESFSTPMSLNDFRQAAFRSGTAPLGTFAGRASI
jgi:hypothetical protein